MARIIKLTIPSRTPAAADGTDASQSPEANSTTQFGGFNITKGVSLEAIQEVAVTKGIFPAEYSNSLSGNVNVITRSGINDHHGALNWQQWQQRWNATPTLTKSAHAQSIVAAEAVGNTAYANELRNKPFRPSGRSNTYSATLGGSVKLPWLFDGRDKLFFSLV